MGMLDTLKQAKQAMAMQKEAKKLQAEVERITCTHENGGIAVTAKGDFSVTQIKIAESALAELRAGKTDRFETMLRTVVNGALGKIREQNQALMKQMMQEGKLPGFGA